MATIKSEYYRFNGVSWDIHYFKTTMDMVDGLSTALGNKLDKRTGIIQSEAMTPDTQALFPYALTTASTAIGMEYNILLYAWRKGYTITQSGSGQIASQNALFDGKLEPQYSPDGIDPANPFVLLIEGLPNIHSQTGGMIGWTARYWFPSRYKVETYDSYISQWRTLLDQSSTAKPTKDLVIPLYSTYSGAHTKIRITIYEAGGIAGANGFKRWGLSEIFFIHPEAQAVHQYLDVEWAKKLSSARAIQIGNTSKNFDGSANLSWTFNEMGVHPNTWTPSLLSVYRGTATALDTLYTPGFYNVTSSTTGQPNASNFGWLHVEVHNNADYNGTNNWLRQTFQQTDGKKYYRYRVNASAWSPWYQEYNSQYKPSLSDLGALVETNQKLLFDGTTQYIRLAYAGNTQAFIKHGADSGEKELWHSGNFNPSDYMPKSGGTFTGTVAFTGLTSFDTLDINTMYVDTISSDGGSISFGGVDNINFGYIDLVGIRGLYSETDAFQLSDEGIPTLRCGIDGTGGFEISGNLSTTLDIYSRGRKVATEGPTAAKTSNYTFVLGDADGFIYSNSASALTFTIPLNSSVAYPTGTEIHIMRYGTGEISISPTSGVTLVSEGSKRRINAQYQAASLKKLDTNTWVLIGALKT